MQDKYENVGVLTCPPACHHCMGSNVMTKVIFTGHTIQKSENHNLWPWPSNLAEVILQTKFCGPRSNGSTRRVLTNRHTDGRNQFYTLDHWHGREQSFSWTKSINKINVITDIYFENQLISAGMAEPNWKINWVVINCLKAVIMRCFLFGFPFRVMCVSSRFLCNKNSYKSEMFKVQISL